MIEDVLNTHLEPIDENNQNQTMAMMGADDTQFLMEAGVIK